MRIKFLLPLTAVCLFLAGPARTGETTPHEAGKMFDRVVSVLEENYYDSEYAAEILPDLAAIFRPAANRAPGLTAEREVVHALLENIPSSHLALYSRATYRNLMNEMDNIRTPTFGCSLVDLEGRFFVGTVLEGGPADEAGLLRWDRVVAIDGVPVAGSRRLDWRSDDAWLDDPPVHLLLCENGDTATFTVESRPGEWREVAIRARVYSTIDAARASLRIFRLEGKRYGYVHFWFVHTQGPAEMLHELCRGGFADCDGLILDLRGRGGSSVTAFRMILALRESWHPRPMAALVDGGTRSAKEVIAHNIRKNKLGVIVGETTAGAVIPATFEEVGDRSVLMFPGSTLGRYTRLLEGNGVAPDFAAVDSGPYSAGRDPILEEALRILERDLRQAR